MMAEVLDEEELAEIAASNAAMNDMSDQWWRLNHLYTIVDKENRVIPFRPNRAQEKLYREMWHRNSILKSRQHGFTTFICILGLDTALFKPNTMCGFIAHSLADAGRIFEQKIKFAYDRLPKALKEKLQLISETKTSLALTNGSSIYCGTSMRSGTCGFLHVSEYGKIAATRPDKAREIKTGAFEAVPLDGMIFVESTAEGNEGAFYDLDTNARNHQGELTSIDFKPHFFAWHEDDKNRLPLSSGDRFSEKEEEYFFQLRAEHKVALDDEQKFWYKKKKSMLGDDMLREHPSTAEEAFAGSVEGALLSKEMARMRDEGRITTVPHDPNLPTYTFWDLGYDDYMTIWFMQRVGTQNRFIRYYQNHLEGPEFYAAYLKNLQSEQRYHFSMHYMPHDVGSVVWQVGKSGDAVWRTLGIYPIRKIEKARNTMEIMAGVQGVRNMLANSLMDEVNCEEGIRCCDNYRKEWDEKNSRWKDRPMHNWAADGVDALRCAAVGFRPFEPSEGRTRHKGRIKGRTGLLGRA